MVRGFAEHEAIKGGRGQNLLPWPNRIRDGSYTFAGQTQQLALSEPARHNASHGLVRYVPWVLVDHHPDSVSQPGADLPAARLAGLARGHRSPTRWTGDGLTATVQATNIGDRDMPFGYAAHPYLTVGEETVDEVELTVPAGSYLEVDDRLLPVRVSAGGRDRRTTCATAGCSGTPTSTRR